MTPGQKLRWPEVLDLRSLRWQLLFKPLQHLWFPRFKRTTPTLLEFGGNTLNSYNTEREAFWKDLLMPERTGPRGSRPGRFLRPGAAHEMGSSGLQAIKGERRSATVKDLEMGEPSVSSWNISWEIVLSPRISVHQPPPSSSGLGHLLFTEATGIRLPLGVQDLWSGWVMLAFNF